MTATASLDARRRRGVRAVLVEDRDERPLLRAPQAADERAGAVAAEVWRRVVWLSLRDAPRLRPRGVRILGSAYTYLPTYGKYLPHSRANVDQVPLPFVNDMESTYEQVGGKRVANNQLPEGCTLAVFLGLVWGVSWFLKSVRRIA